MRRKLGGIESALTITHEFMPLNAVEVLRLERQSPALFLDPQGSTIGICAHQH